MTFFPSRWAILLPQRLGMALLFLLCMALGGRAWADPPGRIGRLGEVTGQVWVYTPDAGEWISAVRNRPLTSGDRLATDTDGHAELRVGSTTVRLDGGTELELLQVDDEHVALQLHNGSVATRIRNGEAAREFELRTAEGRFVANRPGRYRIDRRDDTSNLTVWSGEAVYEGPGSALTVYSGQRAEFWLDSNNAAQYSITEPVRDDFAAWSADRDRRDDRQPATRYVSPEMTGVEDLDRYGRWESAPDYGAVWVPAGVPMGWTPYSTGHWAWVSPWGWTWIDDMPWGFAPFHYGRWAMVRDRWCWVPGRYVARPVYAPALVGWLGGPNFSISVSVGGGPAPAVGWFPLAPHEVYVPAYRVSPGYVQQINITHVTKIVNVTNIVNNPQQAVTHIDYRYRRFPNAVTVVPQTVMVNRQPVAPAASQFRTSQIARRIVEQPAANVVAVGPSVAAPAITPSIAQARRIAVPNEPGRAGVPARSAPQPAAPLAVPAPPTARAHVERPGRERSDAARRDDDRGAGRTPAPAGVPARPAPAPVREAPGRAAPPVAAPAQPPRGGTESTVPAPRPVPPSPAAHGRGRDEAPGQVARERAPGPRERAGAPAAAPAQRAPQGESRVAPAAAPVPAPQQATPPSPPNRPAPPQRGRPEPQDEQQPPQRRNTPRNESSAPAAATVQAAREQAEREQASRLRAAQAEAAQRQAAQAREAEAQAAQARAAQARAAQERAAQQQAIQARAAQAHAAQARAAQERAAQAAQERAAAQAHAAQQRAAEERAAAAEGRAEERANDERRGAPRERRAVD